LAFMDMPATWNGKPTVLRYILVEPTNAAKRRMMISYWASPEGDKTHGDAMSALIESLSQAVDAMQ
jgi:quinol monooxygenase YgiN